MNTARYQPEPDVLAVCKRLAAANKTQVVDTHDPIEAVTNADVIATDT